MALWTVILFIPILLCKMQNLIIEKRGEGRRTLYTNWFPYQQTFTAVFFFLAPPLSLLISAGLNPSLQFRMGSLDHVLWEDVFLECTLVFGSYLVSFNLAWIH